MAKEPDIQLFNRDCMEAMRQMPDNAFDLAIVDPPYGIDRLKKCSSKDVIGAKTKTSRQIASRFQNMDTANNHRPSGQYWQELFRVSKNQIVWGGNYFPDIWRGPQRGFIVWNKDALVDNFSIVELAWTSFDRLPGYYYYAWSGLSDGIRGRNKKEKSIHPTQKPVPLYIWLLDNYAEPGWTILDTHGGSRSLAIACFDLGFDHTSYEIDEGIHRDSVERFERHKAQQKLFTPEEMRPAPVQLTLLGEAENLTE